MTPQLGRTSGRCEEDGEIMLRIPAEHRPHIYHVGEDGYSYLWAPGDPPSSQDDIDLIYETAQQALWTQKHPRPICMDAYIVYLEWKCGYVPPIIKDILLTQERALTPVDICHGDLTLENVVMDQGRPIFIDAGASHGVECREMDEAKMLQSILTKWEYLKHSESRDWDWLRKAQTPFGVRDVHLALLATHWMRLAAHPEKHSPHLIHTAFFVVGLLTGGRRQEHIPEEILCFEEYSAT